MQKLTNKQQKARSGAQRDRKLASGEKPEGKARKPKVTLPDAEVRCLVDMRNSADKPSLRFLARMFNVSATCVARICKGEKRSDATGIEPPRRRQW